jgi:hypothetical protein
MSDRMLRTSVVEHVTITASRKTETQAGPVNAVKAQDDEPRTTCDLTIEEDLLFAGVPREVIDNLGAYEMDCAGGCG